MANERENDVRALTRALQAKKSEIGSRGLATLKLPSATKDLLVQMEIVLANFDCKLASCKSTEDKQTLLESFRELNSETDSQGPCKDASGPGSAKGLREFMAKSEIETARQVVLTFNQLDLEFKKVYMCEICGAMFNTAWEYLNHVYFAHHQPEGKNDRYWEIVDSIFEK